MRRNAWGLVVGAAMLVAPLPAKAEPRLGVLPLAAPPRPYDGTRDVGWSDDMPESSARPSRRDLATRPSVPRPVPPKARPTIRVAIGMSPAMPGSKLERDLLQRLERSSKQSVDPPADVRRLRPGVGEARQICRERKDDLVVMLGYVADREEPVVLAHDCRLDAALPVRPAAAVDEIGLLAAFWDEHDELVRNGAKERRIAGKLSQKARAGIAAGIAVIVIGVAVGLIVGTALRKEKVVLKVEP